MLCIYIYIYDNASVMLGLKSRVAYLLKLIKQAVLIDKN